MATKEQKQLAQDALDRFLGMCFRSLAARLHREGRDMEHFERLRQDRLRASGERRRGERP